MHLATWFSFLLAAINLGNMYPILKMEKFWLHGAVRKIPRPIKLCPTPYSPEAKVAKQKGCLLKKESVR